MKISTPKVVLHVGCGPKGSPLPDEFAGWREIRLDIDPGVEPDLVASIVRMDGVPDASADAVFTAHNLEHLHSFEVPDALAEFRRVLRPGGRVVAIVPDLGRAAELIAAGGLEDVAYVAPCGPIRPLDIVFGWQTAVASGNAFMAHRTGFTAATLAAAFFRAGFRRVDTFRAEFDLGCTAWA